MTMENNGRDWSLSLELRNCERLVKILRVKMLKKIATKVSEKTQVQEAKFQ